MYFLPKPQGATLEGQKGPHKAQSHRLQTPVLEYLSVSLQHNNNVITFLTMDTCFKYVATLDGCCFWE